jgi:hypothetical protein
VSHLLVVARRKLLEHCPRVPALRPTAHCVSQRTGCNGLAASSARRHHPPMLYRVDYVLALLATGAAADALLSGRGGDGNRAELSVAIEQAALTTWVTLAAIA